jgi:hypothetical protein
MEGAETLTAPREVMIAAGQLRIELIRPSQWRIGHHHG